MNQVVEVEVFFYENARATPPFGKTYRPHFVVDGSNDYYSGVQFIDLKEAPFGERITCSVEMIYGDVGSLLKENVHFIIKEGAKSVGEGVVIKNPVL